MNQQRLAFDELLSPQLAAERVLAHAMYGEHNYRRPRSRQEAVQFVGQLGMDWDALVEQCRDVKRPVPCFQNLLGATWKTMGGGKHMVIDNNDGTVVAEVTGAGELSTNAYRTHFEHACIARDRAVDESSYSFCETAVLHGFSSIESFLHLTAHYWNARHPEHRLEDSKRARSFLGKLSVWIPIVSGGQEISKEGPHWHYMLALKEVRDKAAHPKAVAHGRTLEQAANMLNMFPQGIAAFLGHLHLLLSQPVPAVVLDAIHSPLVRVVDH